MRRTWVVLLLAGCGDPRAQFVGSYKGTVSLTQTADNGDDVSNGMTEFVVTAPAHSDRLELSSWCVFTAIVASDGALQFDPVVCPVQHATSLGGVEADYTFTYNTGAGELTNKTLTLIQFGTELGSNYADGTRNQTYQIKRAVTATKE